MSAAERELLVEFAKRSILSKLNLREQPNTHPTVSSTMLATALRLQGGEEGLAADMPAEGGVDANSRRDRRSGREYQIIIFAEAECSGASGTCLYFQFNADAESSIEVLGANVWLFLGNPQSHRQKVTVTSSLCGSNGVERTLIQQMPLTVQRSGWYNVPLGSSTCHAFSRGDTRIQIELGCPGCRGSLHLANISDSHWPFLVAEARRVEGHPMHRRSLPCSANTDMCCLKKFYVDFQKIGWNNWIIRPEGYYMNYCEGLCPPHLAGIPGLAASSHTTVHNLIKAHSALASMGSCCVATKLRPLSILYFDNGTNIVKKDITDMIVESCGCT